MDNCAYWSGYQDLLQRLRKNCDDGSFGFYAQGKENYPRFRETAVNQNREDKKATQLFSEYASEQYEKMRGGRFYRSLDFLLYLLLIVMTALAIRTFLAEPVRVDGSSMYPNLINDEHMAMEKVSLWFSPPKRGDIVICFYPGYKISCVKRVIGLPGETVSIEGGKVNINGEVLDEAAYWQDQIYQDLSPVQIGKDQYFVMGDNRNESKDSRNVSVGPIPGYKIVGRVHAVIWPFRNIRGIKPVQYS